jgi:hypothetical protein
MLRQLSRADDFDASDGPTEILAPAGAIGPAVNHIVVKCRSTAIERSYTAGSSVTSNGMSGWVNEVAADIRRGAFD